ncbi:hypothetical protein R9C00_27355 [Flammeovirgaceae bacterium SG7u.111]|nr:hypothetical protein [Flammeovirgaceae bacterium SG7u.132]WPO35418.1 hypothetical protein R9C00_27355 [Flammeovirgaceae bacterium SG7u.111]
MKKHLILISALLLLIGCKNTPSEPLLEETESPNLLLTEWAPIGAKWYYSDGSSGQSQEDSEGYYLIESVRDTNMSLTNARGTVDARILEISNFRNGEFKSKEIEVMYGSLDSVYHWDKH